MTDRPADRQAEREELEAALGARRELGRDYEDALVESFLDRIDRRVDERARTAVERSAPRRAAAPAQTGPPLQFVLGVVSLGTGIPITAIAGSTAGTGGLLLAWTGIVGVNVAHALSRRSGR